jgi:hypothetical protein
MSMLAQGEGIAPLILNLRTGSGWMVTPTSRPRYSREINPVAILQEDGWAPGPILTGTENLTSPRFRTRDLPARNEPSRYPGH